jgi:DNA phosphorothioation-dependent restriction protein DptG
MTQQVFSSLGEAAYRKLHELANTSRQKLEEIKKKNLEDLYRDTKRWVSHNPGKTLMGALATGFLIGWLFRRR